MLEYRSPYGYDGATLKAKRSANIRGYSNMGCIKNRRKIRSC